ncbi:MAG: hypothetical protein LOD87_08140 [Planifilum fulgidum]
MQERKREKGNNRTTRLLGLFAAASLLVVAGCDDDRIEICYDDDNDFRCDDDQSEVDPNSYVVVNGRKVGYLKSSAVEDIDMDRKSRVSSGSRAGSRGGIGKSSFFSGG